MATFSSAVNQLRNDHDAAKPQTWRGYVYRHDIVPAAYSATSTYSVDDEVMYGSSRYVCAVAISAPEPFNQSKWVRIPGLDHDIVFVENPDFETSGSGVGFDTHPAYRIRASIDSSGAVTYGDPVALNAGAGGFDGYVDAAGSDVFPLDSRLFAAMIGSAWELGTKEAFDEASGNDTRW